MKRSTKTLLIIAAVCIGIGILFSAIAFILAGGKFDVLAESELKYEKKEMQMQILETCTEFIYEGSANDITLLPTEGDQLRVQYYESTRDSFTLTPAGSAARFTHTVKPDFYPFGSIQSPEVYKIVVYLLRASPL